MARIIVLGRLGKDAEERVTPSGAKVVSFSLAETVKRSGTEETIWYNISCWGDRYSKLLPYLKKGKPLQITGEMFKPKMYEKNGVKEISSIEVRAYDLDFVPRDNSEQPSSNDESSYSSGVVQGALATPSDTSDPFGDDSLPF